MMCFILVSCKQVNKTPLTESEYEIVTNELLDKTIFDELSKNELSLINEKDTLFIKLYNIVNEREKTLSPNEITDYSVITWNRFNEFFKYQISLHDSIYVMTYDEITEYYSKKDYYLKSYDPLVFEFCILK